jgi:hypothetical protein
MLRFANLPKLQPNQSYHFWMHDLKNNASDPISVAKFSPEITVPTEFLVPFKSPRRVFEPYKFSIMLENSAENIKPQPLLLAQP